MFHATGIFGSRSQYFCVFVDHCWCYFPKFHTSSNFWLEMQRVLSNGWNCQAFMFENFLIWHLPYLLFTRHCLSFISAIIHIFETREKHTKNGNLEDIVAEISKLSVLIHLQSALFNFQSLLSVILLMICTCTYLRSFFPSLIDRNKTGYVCVHTARLYRINLARADHHNQSIFQINFRLVSECWEHFGNWPELVNENHRTWPSAVYLWPPRYSFGRS